MAVVVPGLLALIRACFVFLFGDARYFSSAWTGHFADIAWNVVDVRMKFALRRL